MPWFGASAQVFLGLIEGKDDAYVIPFFTRGSDGSLDGPHLGGRLSTRVVTPQ